MKKTIKLLFFILLINSVASFNVFALENNDTTKKNTCDYKTQANLNKLAANVSASYQIETREDGTNVFKISVYNIVNELFVSILDENEEFSLTITPAHLTNGVYTFEVTNTTDVIKYNFVVRSMIEGCTGDIKKFSLIKPKKNKYHDYNECKFKDTEKYSYCQEWITREFSLTESEILTKINEQRSGVKKITTQKCLDCETDVRKSAKLTKLRIIKRILVGVISVLIALDIIYIYVKTCKIKDAEI